ncbi:MAG: phospho-sugar mutase [Bacteroidetes bacterium]|nr:phospho-sugar mutase [Bacteroidota bacterium]
MSTIDSTISERVNTWLNGNYDEETKAALRKLIDSNQPDELTDAFYKDLDFGTGGLRGIMGVGSNRVNKYTIGAATQGLSNYLKLQFPGEQIKVAIAFDNRNNATIFAKVVADVFSSNGIQVYAFEHLRPTPELSFAIRKLRCHSGVMLTASHNPKEYSGYKAYWNDGGQIIAPHDKNIIAEVNKITSIDMINFVGNPKLINTIGAEMDDLFIDTIKSVSINPDAIKSQHNLKIVYSPIHGTGITIVPKALAAVGFTNVNLVEEQCVVDGNFPTVIYPNPEEKEAMTRALQLAAKIDADLVMATDPDADRVGIAVKDPSQNFILLNGNQTGVLLFHYVLEQWKVKGWIKGNEYIVKTIVTTYLLDKIAASKKVTCYNVLTGFKFIGALMTQLEGKSTFICGCEESYGYLVGDHVRDKDSVVACTMIAEMAAFYKSKGKTLYESLIDIYLEYGLFKEELISFTKSGKKGAEEIAAMMATYRTNPPLSLGGQKVVTIRDYQNSIERNMITGETVAIDLPKSNVMQFVTDGDGIVSARPSGTEPKIKFYVSVNTPLSNAHDFPAKEKELDQLIADMKSDLLKE